jgi:hypothetical protein
MSPSTVIHDKYCRKLSWLPVAEFLEVLTQVTVFVTGIVKMYVVTVTVMVKLSLCLTKHHTMKTYWGGGHISMHH